MRLVTWLVVHCLQLIRVDSEQKAQKQGTISVFNDKTTWWESRSRCREEFQADLFQSGHIPRDATADLNISTYYWVGAMAYGTWKWTTDNTVLYQYAGYRKLPTVPTRNETFVDNSVFRCNHHCKEDPSVFGLSENTCYCLEEVPEDELKILVAEAQCSGNWDERCGKVDGMSVYHLGKTPFIPKQTGKCAYVYKNYAGDIYMTTTSCSEPNAFLCSLTSGSLNNTCLDDVFHSNKSLPWSQANGSCNLLTLTTRTCANLAGLLSKPMVYWVGLRMLTSIRWLNGSRVVSDPHTDGTESLSNLPTCLAVMKDGLSKTMRYEWLSCKELHGFICSVGVADNVGIAGISGIGMYIGIGTGCILMVTAMCALVFIRRKKMIRSKKKEGDQQVHFHSGRTTNDVDIDNKPGSSEYCVIDQHEQSLAISSELTPDVYNVLSGTTNQKSQRICTNPYSHLSGPGKYAKYTGDYDTAGSVQHGEDRSCGATGGYSAVPSSVDQQGEHSHLLDVQASEEDQYNVLGKQVSSREGCTHAGIYDRIGTEMGHYDITVYGKKALGTDSYSHTRRPYV